jgi:hypothetical protein
VKFCRYISFHLLATTHIYTIDHLVDYKIRLYMKCKSKFTVVKMDKFKNNKNACHENIDFYNMTMRHRHFGSSMNKNGRLTLLCTSSIF